MIDYPKNRELLKKEFNRIADTPEFRKSVASASEFLGLSKPSGKTAKASVSSKKASPRRARKK